MSGDSDMELSGLVRPCVRGQKRRVQSISQICIVEVVRPVGKASIVTLKDLECKSNRW